MRDLYLTCSIRAKWIIHRSACASKQLTMISFLYARASATASTAPSAVMSMCGNRGFVLRDGDRYAALRCRRCGPLKRA